MTLAHINSDFWHGRRVLLTGHTGFKGSWLALWLQQLGAQVTGLALAPTNQPNLFDLLGPGLVNQHILCDIRDAKAVAAHVHESQPEIVIHLAAQALVKESYCNPLATFATNIMGTANVLDALRGLQGVRVAVMVTTDKVYKNLEQPYPYREDDTLGGHDPYSSSKAASEIVIASYSDAFLKEQGIAVTSARAGNVIGGGDWSEDRLIPDAVRAWQADEMLDIRRPQAIRPWQHVLEPLYGYLTLAETLWFNSEMVGSYNFGPHTHEAVTVRELIELARHVYGKGDIRYGDGSSGPREAGWLALETSKVREALGVQPRWNLTETVKRTMDWYKAQQAGADARELCVTEIHQYYSDEALEVQP